MHAHIWHYEEETCDLTFDPEFYPSTDSAHKHLDDLGKPGMVMLCKNNPGPTSAECRYFIAPQSPLGEIPPGEFHIS